MPAYPTNGSSTVIMQFLLSELHNFHHKTSVYSIIIVLLTMKHWNKLQNRGKPRQHSSLVVADVSLDASMRPCQRHVSDQKFANFQWARECVTRRGADTKLTEFIDMLNTMFIWLAELLPASTRFTHSLPFSDKSVNFQLVNELFWLSSAATTLESWRTPAI